MELGGAVASLTLKDGAQAPVSRTFARGPTPGGMVLRRGEIATNVPRGPHGVRVCFEGVGD
jgi:hypothetical protein